MKVSEFYEKYKKELEEGLFSQINYSEIEKQILANLVPPEPKSELDQFIDECVLGPDLAPSNKLVGTVTRFRGYKFQGDVPDTVWLDEYYPQPQIHPPCFKPTKKQVKSLKKRRLLKRTRGQA